MTTPCPGGCQATIGRLSKELAVEIARNARGAIVNELLATKLLVATDRIDQLEHELAASTGPAMVAEVAEYLRREAER